MTDPRRGPTTELGHAVGLGGQGGYPLDMSEFTPELSWPLNIAVFDRMRRQDSQIKSVLNAVTLPIRRTAWRLDPNGAPPEVVAAIAEELGLSIMGTKGPARRARDRQRVSWIDHVRLACLSLAYGHMPFEIVGQVGDDGLWHLRKLSERLPPTLAKINVDREGELTSIEQYPSGLPGDVGPLDVMPANHIVMYCHEREGGVWQGNSILRTAYRNFAIKDRLIRVDAMKHERNGLGVPGFEAPPNASEKTLVDLANIASKFRAGESSGMAWPAGAKFTLTGVSGSLPDTLGSIKYHDEQMAREALAQFLELVSSSHGSRALATSLIDFFIMALQAAADEIADTTNVQLIEPWVDWNWGEDVPAPKVIPDDLGAQTALTAESVAALVNSGAIIADESIDTFVRESYRMPEKGGALNPPPPAHENPVGGPAPVAAGRRRRPFLAARPGNTGNAPSWPGRSYLQRLVAYYSPLVLAERAGLVDAKMLAKAVYDSGFDPHEYVSHLSLDSSGMDELLRTGYADAYLVGYHAGNEQVAAAGKTPKTVAWASRRVFAAGDDLEFDGEEFDWAAWEPGSPDAAALLAASNDGSTGLAQLLADAGITIEDMDETALEDLGDLLAYALDDGQSVSAAADLIREYLANPDRAEMIAQTEMARAMTVATRDSYRENGVEGVRWLLSDGACELCEENEEAGVVATEDDFPNGDAPVHPNCVCAISPVITTGDGDEIDLEE